MNLPAGLRSKRGSESTKDPFAQRPREFEAPLPRRLRRFGTSVRASIVGLDEKPVVVVLGGISADRFPCRTTNGADGWWSGLAGDGRAIDPRQYRILGFDF